MVSRRKIELLLLAVLIAMSMHSTLFAQAGVAIWRSGTETAPLRSEWNGTAFSTSATTTTVGRLKILVAADDPTRRHITAAGVTDDSKIVAFKYNGLTWLPAPFTPVSTVSTSDRWGASVAYENQSGKTMLIWNNGTTGTQGLSYRVWDGSAWTAESGLDTPLPGEPMHLRMASNPIEDEMVLVASNSDSYDYAFVWDGSDWIDTIVLDQSGGDELTDINVAYEQQTGRAMVVYGASDVGLRYRIWDGPDWTAEGTVSAPSAGVGNANWTVLQSDPTGNRLVLGVLTSSGRVWLAVWTGSAWETSALATASANGSSFPAVAVGFESLSGDAIAVYSAGDPVKYRVWNPVSKWSSQYNVPSLGASPNTVTLDPSPYGDEMMLTVQDDDQDLNCIPWNGTAWGTPTELETSTSQIMHQPFAFVWACSNDNEDPVLETIGPKSVTRGEELSFTIQASDPDGDHLTLIAEEMPEGATFSDRGNGKGDFDFTPDSTHESSYDVRFIASDGISADSEVVTITILEANRPPILTEIGSREVVEGENLNFAVTATDPESTIAHLVAEDLPLNATFTDNDDGTGVFDFTPGFQQAGDYPVRFIASDGELADTELVSIAVLEAPVVSIVISPDSATVSADSILTFSVTGYDAGANVVDPGNISWRLTAPLGTIDADGEFDPVTVGTCRVVATSDEGPVDTSAYLAVTSGELVSLSVSPQNDTIASGSTLQFTVSGQDIDGNAVTDLGTIDWGVQRGIGTITQDGLFTAIEADYGFIRAGSSLGPSAQSDTILVVPGPAASLAVSPPSIVVTEDSAYQFSAHTYDANSNLVSDVTASSVWTDTDPTGTVSAGLYTAGNNPSPPQYYVRAESGGYADSAAVTVISSGAVSHIRVESEAGIEFPDTILSTDIDSTTLFCRAYDSGDNLIGDVPATWTLSSATPIGSLQDGPATSSRLTLTTPGTGRAIAQYAGAMEDSSGLITCNPGAPNVCTISPDTATVHSDSSLQFTAEFFDADGNTTAQPATLAWSVLGDIGTVSPEGLFAPSQTGTGYVVCTGEGIADTTGVITVTAGELFSLSIFPDSVQLAVGATAPFSVEGFDEDGNPVVAGTLTWHIIGDIGDIDDTGLFTAQTEGVGRVVAESSINGVSDTNRAVVVQSSSLQLLVVSPDTASMAISGSRTFSAIGFDASYQPTYTGNITWQILGGIGDIDSLGNFTATSKGSGKIIATSDIDGVSDTTSLIVVEVPTASSIPIGNMYTNPGSSLSPVAAFSIRNAFDSPNQLTGVTTRLQLRGAGSDAEQLTNIDSLFLYRDANGNDQLDASDTRLAAQGVYSRVVSFAISGMTLAPASDQTFMVAVRPDIYAHDSDSIDAFILPAADLRLSGGIAMAGPDTLNSLGRCIINGMVANQIELTSTGLTSASPGSELVHVMTIDVPGNGYTGDSLQILSVVNSGTAGTDDIDSLILFVDNGNGVWNGAESESAIGGMRFTGGLWTVSGLSEQIADPATRFHVAAVLSHSPTNGASMSFGIPIHGIEVYSKNDGPIDGEIAPIDNIVIQSSEALLATVSELPERQLLPGESTGPILAVTLTNTLSGTATLEGLNLQFNSIDPAGASQQELDSQIESVSLWINNDGDLSTIGASDILLDQSTVSNGTVEFAFNDVSINSGGGSLDLFAEARLSGENAKNGNTIEFSIANSSDIALVESITASGDFPLSNTAEFTVDAFQSSAVTVNTVDGTTLLGGAENQPILDITMPGDGYDTAVLNSFKLRNASPSDVSHALSNIKLWIDTDLNGFDSGDMLIAQLYSGGVGWLNDNITAQIPQSGARLIVTVSVSASTAQGGTLTPQVPVGGIQFLSGTTGPDDMTIQNPESFVVLPSNQVTVVSVPILSKELRPGSEDQSLLMFALYNGYPNSSQTLEAVRLRNLTRSASSQTFADTELGQVSLYFDSDSNRVLEDDPLIASGYFSSGSLNLSGLSIELEPQSINHFFVVSDLPLNAIDSDTLIVGVESSSDFTFSEGVNVNGDVPLLPGGDLVVDGSVAAQFRVIQVPVFTVYPGQNSVALFSFQPASNGDLTDTLEELTLANLGSASGESITSLQLWADSDGDSSWQSTDQYIGEFLSEDQTWRLRDIALATTSERRVLFAVADISTGAATGTTMRMSIPIDGCQFSSGNDGPLDASVRSGGYISISDAGLQLAYEPFEPAYSIGQSISLDMTAVNRLTSELDSVYCRVVSIDHPELVSLTDSSLGPLTLTPGGEESFSVEYTAIGAGTVSWELQAFSASSDDSSAIITTQSTTIQEAPANAIVKFVSSIPTSATRGQTHIYPLSLICSHSNWDQTSAPLRLESMTLDIQDASGNPIPANSVFSRVVLSAGYTVLSIDENPPSETSMPLAFADHLTIPPGAMKQISLSTDIDSLATAEAFSISISSAGSIPFVDDNSGDPVPISSSVSFPLKTATCRIDYPSENLRVTSIPRLSSKVNYGQQNAAILDLLFTHPGSPGSSQIQLSSIEFTISDREGNPVAASDVFESIRVQRRSTILGLKSIFDHGEDKFAVSLSSPPVFSPGETDTLSVVGSFIDQSDEVEFVVTIEDSTCLQARDLSSGSVIAVIGEVDSLLSEYAFPISSGISEFMHASIPPEVCLQFALGESIVAGADSINLLDINIDYAAPVGHAPIRVQDVRLIALDSTGRALDPHMLFDRVGYRTTGNAPRYQDYFNLQNGYIVFDLGDPCIGLSTGENVSLELIADIRHDVAYDDFILATPAEEAVGIVDDNDTLYSPGFIAPAVCQYELPLTSGVVDVFVPASRPEIFDLSGTVKTGFRAQRGLTVPLAELSYVSSSRQGNVRLEAVELGLARRTHAGWVAIDGSDIFERVALSADGETIAADSSFEASGIALPVENGYGLTNSDQVMIALVCDIRSDVETGNYSFILQDSTGLTLVDENMLTPVYPLVATGTYPLRSAEMSISQEGLSSSLSNYPNPFNPSDGDETRITFMLPDDAVVDVEMFSITGELVRRIARGSSRSAGQYDRDIWSGKNDNGFDVAPGTYFCRVTVRYQSGEVEEALRKIAVIR